jgi:hypothetical protein
MKYSLSRLWMQGVITWYETLHKEPPSPDTFQNIPSPYVMEACVDIWIRILADVAQQSSDGCVICSEIEADAVGTLLNEGDWRKSENLIPWK